MQITAQGPVASTYVVKSKQVGLGEASQQVGVRVRAAETGVIYVAGLKLLDGTSAYIDFNRRVMCFGGLGGLADVEAGAMKTARSRTAVPAQATTKVVTRRGALASTGEGTRT